MQSHIDCLIYTRYHYLQSTTFTVHFNDQIILETFNGSDFQIVNLLFRHGANVNEFDAAEITPLCCAIIYGNLKEEHVFS